jgi:hypothetical protein
MSRKKLTAVVLGAFLILSGLAGLISGLDGLGLVTAILAVAAGVLILVYTPGISFRIGWLLAAIYLIVYGLSSVLDFSFSGMGTVMAVLALAAGVLLLIRMGKARANIGYLLFFIWLILVGLVALVSLGQLGIVMDILALAAGILIIAGI